MLLSPNSQLAWSEEGLCQGAQPLNTTLPRPPGHFQILILKHKETKKGTMIPARVTDPDYCQELLFHSSRWEGRWNPGGSMAASLIAAWQGEASKAQR